jgi:hypothetical protein
MGYSFRLYDSIHDVPLDAWRSLQHNETDLYMTPGFIGTVEATMGATGRFWSLLIDDDNGRPAASACLSLYPLDAALLCPPRPRQVLEGIRRVWASCLKFPILFCGLPVSAGQNHLRIADGADTREVFRQLDAALTRLAAQVKSAAIVIIISGVYERTTGKYKEPVRDERTGSDCLSGIKYVHMEAGHASQNVYLQATSLRLGTVAIGALSEGEVRQITGMPDDERPLYIMPVGRI